MDNTLGKLLGSGAGSDVYEYGENKVCKLYVSRYGIDSVKWEYEKTLNAYNNGLPAPKVYKIVEHDGRFGLVMERIQGETFNMIATRHVMEGHEKGLPPKDIFYSPVIIRQIKDTAQTLYNLHQCKCDLIDTAKDSLTRSCGSNPYLRQDEKLVIHDIIQSLPDGDSVCHGDPNGGNFMYHQDRVYIIDWVNCVKGHPFYDIAEYVLMNQYPTAPPDMSYDDVLYFTENSIQIFLNEYKELSGMDISDVQNWTIPILVSKMGGNNSEEKQMRLLEGIRDGLCRL